MFLYIFKSYLNQTEILVKQLEQVEIILEKYFD